MEATGEMRLLLDTNALIWSLAHHERLSPGASSAIEDPGNDVFVSVVSAWEIEIKTAKGKLHQPTDLRAALGAQGFAPLNLEMKHVLAVESLPRHHRDPFDRILVAQAQVEGLTLVTSDREIRHYPVAVLPAT